MEREGKAKCGALGFFLVVHGLTILLLLPLFCTLLRL